MTCFVIIVIERDLEQAHSTDKGHSPQQLRCVGVFSLGNNRLISFKYVYIANNCFHGVPREFLSYACNFCGTNRRPWGHATCNRWINELPTDLPVEGRNAVSSKSTYLKLHCWN